MKLGLKNRLRLISLVPLIILFSVASYFVYSSYQNYVDADKLKNKLVENKYLNDLLTNVARERGMSAMYVGKGSDVIFASLSKQRTFTDKAVAKYLDFLKNNSESGKSQKQSFIQKFKTSVAEFKKIRPLVDKRSVEFEKMFDTYTKTQKLLIDETQKLGIKSIDPVISRLFSVYITFIKAKEYSGIERGYVSYFLSKKAPMEEEQISRLISIIGKADAIAYDAITDKNLKAKLDAIFENEDAKELFDDINAERTNILAVAKDGDYDISAGIWFAMISEKIKLLTQAEKLLSAAMDARAAEIQQDSIQILAIAVTIWLIAILLAVLGYFISNQIARNIRGLQEILLKAAEDTGGAESFNLDLDTAEGTEQAYRLLERIIEQTKKDKEAALEANEAKSMFLANMSHEIRTPLNGIVGFTELLRDTELNEEQMEFVEIIEKSSENLLEIINNILDLSKIESNKLEIEDIVFNPIEEFESAVEVYAVRASEKNIDLGCFIDPRLEAPLKGDPTKLKEVIINLLSNAVKFTSSGGSINVDIREVESHQEGFRRVRFEVQDSGIGVTSEQKARIFEAFSQADTSITRKYGGTGLGLTISSRFIELMGGQLDLHSEPGEGTTFFFTIDFEEVESEIETKEGKFGYLSALILENPHRTKQQDKYLREYLDYYGVKYTVSDSAERMSELAKAKKYNLMYVDFDYLSGEELVECSELSPSLVLLTKSFNMKQIESLGIHPYKTLYEPLTTSKVKRSLEDYKEEEKEVVQEEHKKVEEKPKTIKSFKEGEAKFKAKVLVAEDNIINQKLIKRTLEDLGLEVGLASNGLEAFQKRKDGDYDLIFMDIQMPFLDGVEATKEILAWEKEFGKKHVPIVALTANALKGDRERFLAEGLDEYTTKPLVRDEIVAILNHFLADHIVYINEENEQGQLQNESVEKVDTEGEIKAREAVENEEKPQVEEEVAEEEEKPEIQKEPQHKDETAEEQLEIIEEKPEIEEKLQFEEESGQGGEILQESEVEEEETSQEELLETLQEDEKEKLEVQEEPLELESEESHKELTEAPLQIEENIEIEEEHTSENEENISEEKYTKDVLVIKKSSLETNLFCKVIESLDYECDKAAGLEEGIEKTGENGYKVIVVDAELDGFDIDKLKESTSDSKIVVVRDSLTSLDEKTKEEADEVINNFANQDTLRLVLEKFIKG